MGKKFEDGLEKVVKVGGAVGSVIAVWDKVSGWWSRRKEAKAEAKRIRAFEIARRTEHELQLMLDGANTKNGPCSKAGCHRPNFHAGEHGPALRPWGKGKGQP